MLALALQLLSPTPSSQQRPRPRSAPGLEFPEVRHTVTAAPSRRLLGSVPRPIADARRSGPAADPSTLRPPGASSRCHPRVDATPAESSGSGVQGRAYLAEAQWRRGHRAAATAATAAEAAWPGRPGTAGWTPLRPVPRRPWRAERPPLPSRATEPPSPAPPAPRLRPARGTFPGVPGNHGPPLQPSTPLSSLAPCSGGPGRTPPSRPPGVARDFRDRPSGGLRTPKPHLPRFQTPATQNWRICPFIFNSVLFNGPKVLANL